MTLRDILRTNRTIKGFSQENLAELANVSRRTICEIEAGKIPRAKTLKSIAIALELPSSVFLDADDIMSV